MSTAPPAPSPAISDVFNLTNYRQLAEGLDETEANLLYLKLIGGTISGSLAMTSAVDSTLPTTGALTLVGGAGIQKAISAGGRIRTFNTTDATTTSTGSIIADGGIGCLLQIRAGGTINGNRFFTNVAGTAGTPAYLLLNSGYGLYQSSPLGTAIAANSLAQVTYLSTSVAQYSCGQQFKLTTDALATYTLTASDHFYTNTRNTPTTAITLPLATVGTQYIITNAGQIVAGNFTVIANVADQFVSGGVLSAGPLTLAYNFTMTLRCIRPNTWHYVSQ